MSGNRPPLDPTPRSIPVLQGKPTGAGHWLGPVLRLGRKQMRQGAAIGIAVANSILLVSFAERRRHENIPLLDATTEGAAGRLRAVLMTASAMIFGMVPMAVSRSVGEEAWKPLGVTMLGGLSVSMLVTLVLVPTIYFLFERRRARNRAMAGA